MLAPLRNADTFPTARASDTRKLTEPTAIDMKLLAAMRANNENGKIVATFIHRLVPSSNATVRGASRR